MQAHNRPLGFASRAAQHEVELARALGHGANGVVHEVRVQPCPPLEEAPELRFNFAYETTGRDRIRPSGARHEYPCHPPVVAALRAPVAFLFQPVVIAERLLGSCQWIDHRPVAMPGPLHRDLFDDPVDIFEFANCRPVSVVAPPASFGLHPDSKGFREVLRRVTLRVPVPEMQHMTTTARPWRIVIRIRCGGSAECVSPVSTPPQRISIVDSVPGFVAQYPHAPFPAAAFDFTHDIAFELAQSRMREVERNGKARDAIRGKPLGRHPDMRSKPDVPALQLVVQPLNVRPYQAVP